MLVDVNHDSHICCPTAGPALSRTIERIAFRGHVAEQLRSGIPLAVRLLEPVAFGNKLCDAHCFDMANRATDGWAEAPAKNRTHVGIAGIAYHALFHATGAFNRLYVKESPDQVFDAGLIGAGRKVF